MCFSRDLQSFDENCLFEHLNQSSVNPNMNRKPGNIKNSHKIQKLEVKLIHIGIYLVTQSSHNRYNYTKIPLNLYLEVNLYLKGI